MALLEKLNKLTAQNIFLDDNTGGKGRYYKSRFLQPGLVKYSFGVCVLSKETIDKFVDGFVGCPVIINHKDVTNENAKEERVGVISRVWYDDKDGWFWCEGVIFEEKAISLIEDGYNVSCQYEITEYSNNTTKALHNGNPYDKVILNGKPEHLAIVKTPRYESAMIAVNAIDLTADNARGFGGEEGDWITVKGVHIFVKKGQSKEEAVKQFIDSKQEKSSSSEKSKKGSYKPDQGEDSPRHIYGKKTETSVPVATKVTNYPNWNKVEVLKEFDDESSALDYAEERGEKVKRDYINKTKDAQKYGLVEWMEPKTLEFIKKHGYYPEDGDLNKSDTKDNVSWKDKEIPRLGKIQEVFTHKDGSKQYKINGEWYAQRIIDDALKLDKYKKYTVQDIRKKIQDKKIDELKDIYEKYTSSDKADYFPNLFERAATGGSVPKDLWLEHNMKELIAKKQSGTKDSKRKDIEHNGAKISIIPDGKYSDIKIDAPEGKTFKNGDTWYRTQALTEKAEEHAKKIIDGEFGQSETKSGDHSNIKQSRDEHGRLILSKDGSNKKVKIHKNGNYYLASYGQELKDDDGYTEFQLFPGASGKTFKTESGAIKWANKMLAENELEKNTIIQAINELKENNMFNKLFKKKEKQMDKDELKSIFMDCIQDVLRAQNEAEDEDIDEKDAENEEDEKEEKAENKKACNEDKRKLIDEVAGMMKSAGCDDEVIRTAIAKMEKIGYEKSEAGTADNCGKKGKNEEVEVEEKEEKEEVANKAKNSIEALKGLLSSGEVSKPASKYITKSQAIELGNQLF